MDIALTFNALYIFNNNKPQTNTTMKTSKFLSQVLTITLTSAALLTASCKKDKVELPASSDRLIRFEQGPNDYTTFEYNTAGAISKLNTTDANSTEVIALSYGDNKKLATATSTSSAMKFNYNAANQVEKVELHDGSLQAPVSSHLQYAYQNNLLSELTTYSYGTGQANPQAFYKLNYEYLANGDVKSQKEYGRNFITKAFELSSTSTYEYDNHPNPLKALGEIYQVSFEIASTHNPTKVIETDKNNNLVQTTTCTYIYNSNGYPIQAEKKVIVPGQTNPTVSTVKYMYQ
jgi:hypothetical protein